MSPFSCLVRSASPSGETRYALGHPLLDRYLECRRESACETCAYFQTGPEFVPVLMRQRDHARDHHQPERAALFDGLISRREGNA